MNSSPKCYFLQPTPEWEAAETCSEIHLLPAENFSRTVSYPKRSVEQTISQWQIPQGSGNVGSSSSEYQLDDTMQSGEWQETPHTLFTATHYASNSLASMLQMQSDGLVEGEILRELLGRLGGGTGNVKGASLALASEGLQSLNFKAANEWKALDASGDQNLALKPAIGCIEMTQSTSHCLTQDVSDPKFSGRSARLSTLKYWDGDCVYLGQPIASLNVEEKNDVRPEASQTRASSGLFNLNTLAMQTPPLSSATANHRTKNTRSWESTRRAEVNNLEQDFSSDSKLTELELHNYSARPSTTNRAQQRASMEPENHESVEIHLNTSAGCSLNTEQNRDEQRLPAAACLGTTLRKKRKSTLMEKSKDDYCLTSVPDGKKSATEATSSKKHQSPESGKNITEEVRIKMERITTEHSRDSSSHVPNKFDSSKAPPDPPKLDYIHVRARRGEATDSHSLAERVRREKIGERMKFLQDLVPGCSKVTGKALMLDEIINYVQSLQRQVEFLSMKLATLNTRSDFSLENVLSKEISQPHIPTESFCLAPELATNLAMLNILQNTRQFTGTVGFDFISADSDQQLNTRLTTMNNAPMLYTFGDTISQTPSLWDGELQSVTQMGFASGMLTSIGSECLEKL